MVDSKVETKETNEVKKEEEEVLDDYEYGGGFYNTKELRAKVEARLKPLDIEQFLFNGFLTQEILLGKKTKVVFRSQQGSIQTLCRRIALDKLDKEGYPADTILSYYQLAASIDNLSVNDRDLILIDPTIIAKSDIDLGIAEKDKDPYLKDLEKRVSLLERLPQNLLTLISTNYGWFDDRVNKLFLDDLEDAIANF